MFESFVQWRRVGSNHRPIDYEPIALTTELRRQKLPQGRLRQTEHAWTPSARTLSGETPPQYPRQDSNLRHRLRRPVLYPLSYGGLHATNDAVGFILPILSSPSSVSSRPSPRRAAADLAVAAGRLSADATAATGPNRPGCPGLSGPPALLPWSPHLRAAVAGRHPRLPGELSPLPRAKGRTPRRRQVCSLLRLLSSGLADRCPRLLFRGAHMYMAVGKFL